MTSLGPICRSRISAIDAEIVKDPPWRVVWRQRFVDHAVVMFGFEVELEMWSRSSFSLAVRVTGAVVAGMLAGTALGANLFSISQKDREFRPREIAIRRGETLRFINDDGELLHHAYLSSDAFSFDSGDQKPGSQFDVVFSVAGDYTVLCGIHPKMKLAVHVAK
jgi:plastocyanin